MEAGVEELQEVFEHLQVTIVERNLLLDTLFHARGESSPEPGTAGADNDPVGRDGGGARDVNSLHRGESLQRAPSLVFINFFVYFAQQRCTRAPRVKENKSSKSARLHD